jgi:hypothetical protein
MASTLEGTPAGHHANPHDYPQDNAQNFATVQLAAAGPTFEGPFCAAMGEEAFAAASAAGQALTPDQAFALALDRYAEG